MLTEGVFDPRQDRPPPNPDAGSLVRSIRPDMPPLVSVISPTSFSRRMFHPLLYECFCGQAYEPKELVVVDTGPEPSEFMMEKARLDPRVVYRHYLVADSKMDLPPDSDTAGVAAASFHVSDLSSWQSRGVDKPASAWSLGLKRNVACQLARGEIIAHFDDDDLYGPEYLNWMVGRLREVIREHNNPAPDRSLSGMRRDPEKERLPETLGPGAVTLSEWHLLDLSDMTFGFMDVKDDPLIPKKQKRGWLFGWGFSYVFTRAAWELTPVPDVEWSEDIEFYTILEKLKVCVVPVELPKKGGAICAHSYHPKVNTSGCEFAGPLRCGEPVEEQPKAFKALLPAASEAAAAVVAMKRAEGEEAFGEHQGVRVSLSEKKEFIAGRGQAWFKYQKEQHDATAEGMASVGILPTRRPAEEE